MLTILNQLLHRAQTCHELAKLSRERSVWISQCDTHIRSKGYPFPTSAPSESLSAADIERQAHICDRVTQKWVGFGQGLYAYPRDGARFSSCHRVRSLESQREKPIRDVRFIDIHGRSLVLLHCKDDWSVLELWDVGGCGEAVKLCKWSPRGTIIKCLSVNSDMNSEATLAVGVLLQPEYVDPSIIRTGLF